MGMSFTDTCYYKPVQYGLVRTAVISQSNGFCIPLNKKSQVKREARTTSDHVAKGEEIRE